ncbi:hypothetical protein [Pseudomonas gingeri]
MTMFSMHDDLKNASAYSATLSLDRLKSDRRSLPLPKDLTGTVSFISFGGTCYAVTARHVVEYFAKLAKQENQPLRYLCPVNEGLKIRGPFVVPPENFAGHTPDVAIFPISEAQIQRIGKRPFVISEEDPVWPLPYAVATGFPTAEKKDVKDRFGGFKLSMPFVSAVAEGNGADGKHHTVIFYSELASLPSIKKLSGMSGGPAFWSDGERYGLVGFVSDAMEEEGGQVMGDTPKVQFMIERADQQILTEWLDHVERIWPQARAKQDADESVLFQKIREESERGLEAFFKRGRKNLAYRLWCEKLAPGDRFPRKKNVAVYTPEWW